MPDLTTAKGRRSQMRRDRFVNWWRYLFTTKRSRRKRQMASAERFAELLRTIPHEKEIYIVRVEKAD